MKISKIVIKNLFGITEQELSDKSVEITGITGAGKTSIIDAIKYALTNSSDRDFIIRNGSQEGEILIETDNGLVIDRKKRANKSDYKSVKQDGIEVAKPESFLQEIFTPLQLNPVEFTQMSTQEQNRVILDLIEFDWDMNYIQEKFDEIPQGVNYEQNILQVLNEIQAKDGYYYKKREDVNRDIRNKTAFIEDIIKDIPDGYIAEKWENYNIGDKYRNLEALESQNNLIERAQNYKNDYENKVKAINDNFDLKVNQVNSDIDMEIQDIKAKIAELESRLPALESKRHYETSLLTQEHQNKLSELRKGIEQADEVLKAKKTDTSVLRDEIEYAQRMIKHLNEYHRMQEYKKEVEDLKIISGDLTEKIELARNLPAEILKEAKLPVDYLTIEDGRPLIKGLPVSNLSDGEKLDLCVDITLQKTNTLKLILIDGAEKLSEEFRNKLYNKCKEKGLQFIATRTDNSNELTITEL